MPTKKQSRSSNSSKKVTPKSPRAPFQEPVPSSPTAAPPSNPWTKLGITEQEYLSQRQRINNRIIEWRYKDTQDYLVSEWNSISYWERRIQILEMFRQRYHKMRAWSADVIHAVDVIDAQIAECEERIEEIWDEVDRVEQECD